MTLEELADQIEQEWATIPVKDHTPALLRRTVVNVALVTGDALDDPDFDAAVTRFFGESL